MTLVKLIGEKVMGWDWFENEGPFKDPYFLTKEGLKIYEKFWNPLHDMNHAWQIVEKLNFSVSQAHTKNNEWIFGVYIDNLNPESEDPDEWGGFVWRKTANLAICAAALKTLGIKIPDGIYVPPDFNLVP